MKLALGVGAVLVLAAVSTSSAPAGGPLLCSARTLSARAGLQGAAGALEGGVTVTNRRPYPCTLSGRPGVIFLRGGSGLRVQKVSGPSTTGQRDPRTFVLVPGQKAFARLRWSNWCGKRYSYVGLLLTLRTQQPRLIVDGTAPTPPCLTRSAGSVVSVGPWESR
jgi:Domain of unknown function (DUF4232)